MSGSAALWVASVEDLLREVVRPGRLSLVVGERSSGRELLLMLAGVIDDVPVSITRAVLAGAPVASEAELLARLEGHHVVFDVETLCWSPWMRLDPIKFLRRAARKRGVVALWPGEVSGRTATFSGEGRRDHVRTELHDTLVLRPVPTRFPDEVPFILERIPA